jgi:F-type H+-transporting ATPase subunit delta
MSHDDRVARRYARALFLIAERRGMVAEALDELQGLLGLVHADPRIGHYFRSPLVPLARKRALLRGELAKGPFPPVASLVDLLLRKKRLGLFPVVVHEFEQRVRRWRGLQAAEAVSAVPLTADQLQRLRARLEQVTGLTLELETRVDPELIGGLYVRIGDHVIDHSVKGLLGSLRDRLFETSLQTRPT